VTAAAVEVFNEKGYASASIQDVADRVGVLKGSLYHYIDSKEDLLAGIFDESDEQSFSLMEESRNQDLTAVERLRWFVRAWSIWYLENTKRTAIYVNEWRHLTGPRLKKVVEMRHEYESRVAEMIDDVKKEGKASAGLDVRYACFFVLSAINGLPTWYRRGGPDPADHIADVYAEMIISMVCNAEDVGEPVRTPAPPAAIRKRKSATKRKPRAKTKP
jgi:AcrR family transcriptional regulator